MTEVSITELRSRGGRVLDRAAAGETVTITRHGRPVAELRPVGPTPLAAAVLRERWRRLPHVDPARLRADLDAILDPRV